MSRFRFVSCTAMATLLILTMTIDCGKPHYTTPSMHRRRISSCAVAVEGLPVCRDPEETVDNYSWPVTRTPYPRNGLDAVKGSSPSMVTVTEKIDENKGSDRKSRAWWWLFGDGHPKRTHMEIKTSTIRRDTSSSSSSSWPETTVTYLMKGCSPIEMPFNLPPCSARERDVGDDGNSDGQLQQAVKSTVFSTTRVIYYLPPSTDDFFSDDSDLPSVLV